MTDALPHGWLDSDVSWMVQHLDATRLSYQQELQRLLLGVIELRDLLQRVEASEMLQAQSAAWQDCIQAMELQFERLLASFGVESLQLAEHVNPEIHHVVGLVDQSDAPGSIAAVLLPGYRWNGSLLRAAEVIARRPSEPSASNPSENQGTSDEIRRH